MPIHFHPAYFQRPPIPKACKVNNREKTQSIRKSEPVSHTINEENKSNTPLYAVLESLDIKEKLDEIMNSGNSTLNSKENNEKRINKIKESIKNGNYQINTAKLVDKLIEYERQIG